MGNIVSNLMPAAVDGGIAVGTYLGLQMAAPMIPGGVLDNQMILIFAAVIVARIVDAMFIAPMLGI